MLKNTIAVTMVATFICFLPSFASAHVVGGQAHHHCHAPGTGYHAGLGAHNHHRLRCHAHMHHAGHH